MGYSALLAAMLGFTVLGQHSAQAVEYTTAPPLSQVIKTPVKDCGVFSQLPMPTIVWGGDMDTILANGNTESTAPGSIFQKEGLSVRLYRQDRLTTQIDDYLSCRSPFIRATVGMVSMASDVLNQDPRTAPVLIYQMTWSDGADAYVATDAIKEPKDLLGKRIALQAYGPHVDFLTTVLKTASISPSQVTVKWLTDITDDPKNKNSMYPAKAVREDKSVDAAFVISPDADALTKVRMVNNKLVCGMEDSVCGWNVGMTTKLAGKTIPDGIVVRRDWYDANRDKVQAIVHALMLAQEAAAKLTAEKQSSRPSYDAWLKASAKMLLDDANATSDAEGLWSGARFVGWRGNVAFLTNQNEPRNLARLTAENSEAFGPNGLKLIAKPVVIKAAELDYQKLAVGLTDVSLSEAPRFDQGKVTEVIRRRQQMDTLSVGQANSFPIYFKAQQSGFPADEYAADFDHMINDAAIYSGGILVIEGNVHSQEYLIAKAAGIECRKNTQGPAVDECLLNARATPMLLSNMRQVAKGLSMRRAIAVRTALLAYAESKGIPLDASQFQTVGQGFSKPNVPGCTYDADGDISLNCRPRSQAELDHMMRATVRVISMEVETAVFKQ